MYHRIIIQLINCPKRDSDISDKLIMTSDYPRGLRRSIFEVDESSKTAHIYVNAPKRYTLNLFAREK